MIFPSFEEFVFALDGEAKGPPDDRRYVEARDDQGNVFTVHFNRFLRDGFITNPPEFHAQVCETMGIVTRRRRRGASRQAPKSVEPPTKPKRSRQADHEAGVDLEPVPAFDPWEAHAGPRFPPGILPPVLDEFAAYHSETTGADYAGCAMAALAACSGALDQRFNLKMKASGSWRVRPGFWLALVGDPGTSKTPLINGVIAPLRRLESETVEAWRRAYARWQETEKAERGNEPALPLRLLAHDATSEKLGEMLSHQERGVLYVNDELSGWLGLMEKHGGGRGSAADRAFWNRSFDGGQHIIDRIGRGSIYVSNLAISALGGIQPDRLPEIARLGSDGLLQRFVPLMMRRPTYACEVADDAPAEAYNVHLSYLASMKPCGLIMDEGGRRAAEEFQRFTFDLVQTDAFGKGFGAFAGKLGGLHGRLALALHLIENPKEAIFEPVSERVVRSAAHLIERFVIPHALEFYASVGEGADRQPLQAVASFILTSERERFRPSDFTAGCRSLAGLGLWDLARRISPLVAGGWLIEEYDGGAVPRAWTVVPGLREGFAARREAELKRKADAIQRLRSLGHEEDPK